ncbi:MAG: Maf family protein [Melioribacteraceae bacterium]|nr:Maf family protein [Melioribacteraceae bacterium]MCF8395101.1 Maf family protein [Melioribacteraceae bacterium]MCF8420510.1 Maf family protein [Melioribacteraceae bacterium]
MVKSEIPIFLASRSPRRRRLLKQLKIDFHTFHVDLDEEFLDGEHPVKTVKRLALDKLKAAKQKVKNGVIITADTIVVLDNEIIGKPKTQTEAISILKKLSGRTHNVYTGYALENTVKNKMITDYECTSVTFRELTETEIKKYVKSGSPMDKAGAYGIQDDFGAVFVSKINGCYYNVVGLPLQKLYQSLKEIL